MQGVKQRNVQEAMITKTQDEGDILNRQPVCDSLQNVSVDSSQNVSKYLLLEEELDITSSQISW